MTEYEGCRDKHRYQGEYEQLGEVEESVYRSFSNLARFFSRRPYLCLLFFGEKGIYCWVLLSRAIVVRAYRCVFWNVRIIRGRIGRQGAIRCRFDFFTRDLILDKRKNVSRYFLYA